MIKLPVEDILHIMSFMSGDDILKFCKTNKNIRRICTQNRNEISKYILKNDYRFMKYPLNLDYLNIQRYLKFLNRKGINTNYSYLLESITDDKFEVVRFLIENDVNNYFEALTTNMSLRMFRFIYDIISSKHETNDVFGFVRNIYDASEDDIGTFGNVLFTAFLFGNVDLVDYLISNFSHLINIDIIEQIQGFGEDRNIDVISDYSRLMLKALRDNKWRDLEKFKNFYETYNF